ncbi:MAG: type II toxin-antitoxin system RelE/ParE family toxin [Candidatus Omnitrophota bacterium]
MASFKIFFKASAEKELRQIPKPFLSKILSKIAALAETPRPWGVKLMRGEERFYRLRQGDYRIVYEIDDQTRTVTVIKIGHRREVYDS